MAMKAVNDAFEWVKKQNTLLNEKENNMLVGEPDCGSNYSVNRIVQLQEEIARLHKNLREMAALLEKCQEREGGSKLLIVKMHSALRRIAASGSYQLHTVHDCGMYYNTLVWEPSDGALIAQSTLEELKNEEKI
jgi:hypothetical protein